MAQIFDLTQTGPELQHAIDQVLLNQQAIAQETQSRIAGDDNLQEQINEIVSGDASVELNVSPAVIHVGQDAEISLSAKTDTEASSIEITGGNIDTPIEGSGFELYGTDTLSRDSAQSVTYYADFVISGLHKRASENVAVVYPILYGAGSTYQDAAEQAEPKVSPAGTYNVSVATAGSSVFFVVPASMTINGATMSGFEFPLLDPQTVTIGDVEYKSYQSANTYDAGTLQIVII